MFELANGRIVIADEFFHDFDDRTVRFDPAQVGVCNVGGVLFALDLQQCSSSSSSISDCSSIGSQAR